MSSDTHVYILRNTGNQLPFGDLVGANRRLPYRILDSIDDAETRLLR